MTPALERAVNFVAALMCVLALLWSADLPLMLRVEAYTEQLAALLLGGSLSVLFVTRPLARGGTAPGAIDIALAALAFGLGVYVFFQYPTLLNEAFFRPTESLVLAAALILLTIEGARRGAGLPLLIVLACLLVYAVLGRFLPAVLQPLASDPARLIRYLGFDTAAMFGPALLIACTVVISFVFFGRVLQAAGGGDFFTDLAASLLGRMRGGAGKVEVVSSALFGTISGSAVSNVMSTGIITIPLMKKAGFQSTTAGAVEAVSSTGGQIMPPVMGAAAFLMAEIVGVSYAQVALAAIIPSLLFYLSVFLQVDWEAARTRLPGYDTTGVPPARDVIRMGSIFLVPFAVLFGGLFWWNLAAENAAIYGALALVPIGMAIGYRGQRLTPRRLWDALVQTGRDSIDIVLVCAVAGLIVGVLNFTGLAQGITLVITAIGQNHLFLLLIAVATVCIILGMGMPTTAVYLLVASLAAPQLIRFGVDPLAAHMFVFFYGILSMITPPVALAAYAAANIAQADPLKVGFKACQLGWPAFLLPFLFVYSPALLLKGSVLAVLVSTAAACVGVWFVSAAIAGWLLDPLSPIRRVAFLAAGILMLLPTSVMAWGVWLDAAAIIAGVALLAFELRRRVNARSAAGPSLRPDP